MINIFLWFLIFIFLILLFKYLMKNNLFVLKKKLLMPLFISIFIIIFVYNLNISIKASINGLTLFISSVFPTVFPFLILCNLLIQYDGITLYSKILNPIIAKPLGLSKSSSFPIAASILCGYPLGAKYAGDIYESKEISLNEYKKLLNIASNCGPIFILGSVGAAMLGNIKYGYILLIANYTSIYIIGLLLNIKHKEYKSLKISKRSIKKNFGQSLKSSMQNAIETTLTIGGFIVLFSVIIEIIKNNAYICIIFKNIENIIGVPKDSIYSIFLGSIEITNGCNIIASSQMNIKLKLSLISFLCSFSGLSIIGQVSAVLKSSEISLPKYSVLKLFQGVISFLITFIACILLLPNTETCISSCNPYTNTNYTFFLILLILIITLLLSVKLRQDKN